MTPYIAAGVPYVAMRSYLRYRTIPQLDMTDTDMMVERVLMIVSVELNIPRECILSKSRRMPERDARHISIHLIRKLTRLPLKAIGKIFKRDHSTMINSLQSVDGWIKHNHKFHDLYTRIEKLI